MGTHLSAILYFEDPLDVRANLVSVASALEDCGWTEPGSWQAPPSEECTSLQEALAQLPDADELLERRPPVLEVSTPAARMDISVARARHIGHDAFGSITLDVHKVGRRFFTDPLDRDERADDLKEAIGALPWRDWKSKRAKQELAERESQLAEARGDLLWLFVTALSELPTLMSLGFYFDDLDPVPGAAALLWFRDGAALAKRIREAHSEGPELWPGREPLRLLPPLTPEEEARLDAIEGPEGLDVLRPMVTELRCGFLVTGPSLFPLEREACAAFVDWVLS